MTEAQLLFLIGNVWLVGCLIMSPPYPEPYDPRPRYLIKFVMLVISFAFFGAAWTAS